MMDTSNVPFQKEEDTILYTTFPTLNDLICAICETDFIEIHDSSSKSNFHWQTMKCRLLIHLTSDVIASPVSGTERFIFVITYKQFLETGKLERILRNFKLVYRGLRSITFELYKSCLLYTIQTKIAPLWNKVGQYLIQEKDFYNHIEGSRAIILDILMKDTNICLKLYTKKIKIPYIKLEDYLPSSVISQFLADPKGYINLSVYNFPLIHVLPSTKKGKLLSVSKEIPPKCIFKDYDQLRRHWKNMYGYSLPKNKDEILYYEIKFLIPKSNIFVYPNLCVASGPLDVIPYRDKESTITQFMSDMLIKLPMICKKQLQISKNVPFATKLGNTTSLVDTMLKNTKLATYSLENNTTSDSQLEFSTRYKDELSKDTTTTCTTLRTHLATIHQLHNTSFDMQSKKKIGAENNISRETNDNFIVSKEETISRYFQIQKPHSFTNTTEQKEHLKLKDKLLKAKTVEKSKVPLPETDENVNIEAMAKNNQLHELKITVLSNWLKKHSVPHNSKGKKSELINKVLSHIKNTQMLQQFRI